VRQAPVAIAIAVLALIAAAAPTGCGFDAFCRDGEPGCAIDACTNQLRDGDETDVDCGGSCAPCATGSLCLAAEDCADGRCVDEACCAPPCVLRTTTLGGPERDQATDAFAQDDGTVVLVGETREGADLGLGPLPYRGGTDVFVAAVRPDGTTAWAHAMGGENEDYAPRVIGHADGRIWMAGSFQDEIDTGIGVLDGSGSYGDLFLVELGADGTLLRARAWDSSVYAGGVHTMVAMPDGGAILTGTNDAGDIYALRLDRDTEPMWDVRFGGRDEGEFCSGGALTPSGALMGGFNYRGDPDIDEATVPAIPGGADYAFALALLDPDTGEMRWARSYGMPLFGISITAASDGAIYAIGQFLDDADIGLGRLQAAADSDAFVARLGGDDGTPQWMVPFSAAVSSLGRSVIPTPDGGVVAALEIAGDLAFTSGVTVPTTVDGAVLAGIDAAGQVQWARDGGGIVVGNALGVRPAPGGSAIAFGGFAGTLTLGTPVATRGQADGFVSWFVP